MGWSCTLHQRARHRPLGQETPGRIAVQLPGNETLQADVGLELCNGHTQPTGPED